MEPEGDYVDTNALANATVLGLTKGPSKVWLNGELLDSAYWSYAEDRGVLSLRGLDDRFPEGAWRSRWQMDWE